MMLSFQQTPTPFNLVRSLLERLTPTAPDARERLTKGIQVAHLGCGRGDVLMTLALAFPNSRFTGFDTSEAAVADAAWLAQARRLDNVTFQRMEEAHAPDTSAFDLVMAEGPITWR